jgi:DNA invertase Pin-like site-specific DNA recombinase
MRHDLTSSRLTAVTTPGNSSLQFNRQAEAGWPRWYISWGVLETGSASSLDRPALQNLLANVRSGKIDIVVVYKVDRLTRSLADFAKLVELFDQHSVSFVSVTHSSFTDRTQRSA